MEHSFTRLENRLRAVEKEQAHISGLLEGLGPTGRAQPTPPHAPSPRPVHVEEAFASLVSDPLSKGTATGLALRGPEEALAARLAINLNAFAAGLADANDVMRSVVDPNPGLIRCLSQDNHQITKAFVEGQSGLIPLPIATRASARELGEYIGAIQSAVLRNWRRPTGVPSGLKATIEVTQNTEGKVLQVKFISSSGNAAFDRSIEQAVHAASPFPLAKNPSLFDPTVGFMFNP